MKIDNEYVMKLLRRAFNAQATAWEDTTRAALDNVGCENIKISAHIASCVWNGLTLTICG
jgi:hypothetical protein